MERGTIFNIQRFSLHDGPGIRTTVFLKGCPLRCLWCHNPEGFQPAPELAFLEGRCIGCGQCEAACPRGARRAPERCLACGACARVCPAGALRILGRSVGVRDVLEEVLKDRLFYDGSGGGVTFSGGEPLAQPRFLLSCLEACRAEGIHTAVDTCGHAPLEDLLAVAERTNLFLYDLKLADGEAHRTATGVSKDLILANLRALAAIHGHIWIRIPIVPGVNDELDLLEGVAALVSSMPSIRQVNLLPYHPLGAEKLGRLNRTRDGDAFATPPFRRLEELAGPLRAAGVPAKIGG